MKPKLPVIKMTAAIKIGVGVIAGIVVVVSGFLLVQNVFTKASDTAPRDIIINGITANGAKIVWTTDQETQGVVEYGSSPTSLNLFAPENQKQKDHSVDVTLLSPGTSYYFQIRIGETKYDNGGVPWTFATKAQQTAATGTTPTPISTTIVPTTPATVNTTPVPTSGSALGPLKGSSLKVNQPLPTSTPIVPTKTPTPIPSPTLTPTPPLASFYCVETDCQKICKKIKTFECSTYDLVVNSCIGKVYLNSCNLITPTPTPTITPTPTVTPTLTPTPTP